MKVKFNNYNQNNKCFECQTLISNNAHFCRKCADELHSQRMLGKNNPMYGKKRRNMSLNQIGSKNQMWKGGKPKCKDCKKELQNYEAIRCSSCARKNYLKYHPNALHGKNNPNFKGWISKEPYSHEWTKDLKELIRNRDNYTCAICNKFGYYVHHIDYNKKNCSEENLITLCRKHHLKTNGNRDYWYAYFNYQIREKGESKIQ